MRKFQPFSMALVPVTIETPEGSFESLALGDPVATPATDTKANKKADKEVREEELDDLMWITALALSRPPERLIQCTAWFELTKARRGKEGLGTETFSKGVKRKVDRGTVRKVGELYQVVVGEAGVTSGPGASSFTSTSTSTSGGTSPLKGGEVPEVRSKTSGSTSGSSEVTSTQSLNDQNKVVPKAPPDDVFGGALDQLLKKSNGKPSAQ
jgi:hypothetical protein